MRKVNVKNEHELFTFITIFVYRKKDAVSRTMDVRKIGVRQLLRYMALL